MKNNEFQSIIKELQTLKSLKADKRLRSRFEDVLVSALPEHQVKSSLSFNFRYAFIGLVLFLLTGSGIVVASEKSQPDSFLYPVKETVEKVKTSVKSNSAAKVIFGLEDDNKEEITPTPTPTSKKNNENRVYPTLNNDSEGKSTREQVLEDLKNTLPDQAAQGIQKALEAKENSSEQSNGSSQRNDKSEENKSDSLPDQVQNKGRNN